MYLSNNSWYEPHTYNSHFLYISHGHFSKQFAHPIGLGKQQKRKKKNEKRKMKKKKISWQLQLVVEVVMITVILASSAIGLGKQQKRKKTKKKISWQPQLVVEVVMIAVSLASSSIRKKAFSNNTSISLIWLENVTLLFPLVWV